MTLSSTDPITVSLTYDNRLRVASYSANSAANSTPIHEADYAYHSDNKLHVSDSESGAPFGQTNKYDFAGRLKGNDVGTPYRQLMSYDAFNNLTHRQTWTYSLDPVSFNATYSKNRKTTGGATNIYDVAGNVTSSVQSSPVDNFHWNFDVAGRQTRWQEFGPYGANQFRGERLTFDGDNRPSKRSGLTMTRIGGVWGDWVETNSYALYSSVTGKKITELLPDGGHYRTHVYYGDTNFADERNGDVYFIATDPVSGSTRETLESGELPPSDESESRNELGGLDTSIPVTAPSSMPEPNYSKGGSAGGAEVGCRIDGIDQDGPGPCIRVLKAGVGDVVDTDPFTASDFGIYRTPRYGYREHKGGGEPSTMAYVDADVDEDPTPVTIATEEDRYLIGWDYHFFGAAGRPSVKSGRRQTGNEIYCNDDVQKAMNRAWTRSRNGTAKGEFGFITYTLDGNVGTADLPITNQNARISFNISKVLPKGAVLTNIFHTHPSAGYEDTPSLGPKPSDQFTSSSSGVDVYVMHRNGLSRINSSGQVFEQIRENTDWLKKCKKGDSKKVNAQYGLAGEITPYYPEY
jgi:hypothetical protein